MRPGVGAFFMVNFYKQHRWRHLRKRILRKDNYLCQLSLRYGMRVEADTVHHIFPLEYYPELKFVEWNLISLCKEQHNALHSREGHNLTQKGEDLKARYLPKYLDWCDKHHVEPHGV